MSKLKREVHAWAKRVRMSRSRVWAIVEGSSNDVPFYETLLVEGAGVTEVEVLQASDLQVDGVSAGGKTHALKLMRALREVNGLQQTNKVTKIDVVFFLDRDDDEYLGKLVDNDHVLYTTHADVEAEIIAHSALKSAVSRTFSVSRAEAQSLTPINPMGDLAERWAEWIALRLASGECQWGDTRFSQISKINRPKYGEVESALVVQVCNRVAEECAERWEPAVERAREHVASSLRSGDGNLLVKGKWVPEFIISQVLKAADSERNLPKATTAQLLTACLLCVDFRSAWSGYATRLAPILTR